MSIKEIIKQHINSSNKNKKLKFQKLTTKISHCQNRSFIYCDNCVEHRYKICNAKLFKLIKKEQFNSQRWQFSFLCKENHPCIRAVIIDNNDEVSIIKILN